MNSSVFPILLGIFIIFLGICNMKGHINSIHFYHRRRVTEKNRLPFGKEVGMGSIIIGLGLIIFALLSAAYESTGREVFITTGACILIPSIITGLALSFHAMIKYNKGIF